MAYRKKKVVRWTCDRPSRAWKCDRFNAGHVSLARAFSTLGGYSGLRAVTEGRIITACLRAITASREFIDPILLGFVGGFDIVCRNLHGIHSAEESPRRSCGREAIARVMEQFRQIGEALGSIKALMVFRDELRVNQRQCCLLVDAYNLAYHGIAEEMRSHLRFDEKLIKWKALEPPLKELHRIFREGEQYIKQCLEARDWWGKAVALGQNADCVEFHIHDLLWCIPVVVEAIENVGEITGTDQEEIYRKKFVFSKKYEKDWLEPKLFQLKLGNPYLVSQELCSRMDTAWKEDRWILSERIAEKRSPGSKPLTKQENRLAELLVSPNGKLFPCSLLTGSSDYQVRRRFGSGNNYKEVQWLGESFSVKHVPFPLLVAVDTMHQIARGMEYLHGKNIYHGDLNPSNILVKTRNSSPDGYLHVKVTGFGLSPVKNSKPSANQAPATNPCIWYAPEVLLEQETSGESGSASKCTEKADVYSFSMLCFELLTGKIPFEDDHLQGDKMSKNIRAGARPLFPFHSPKFLTNLTKRCWHADPSQRPSFSSICRVLRYIKRFLVMNPDHSQPDAPMPPVDYFDLETSLSKKFASWARKDTPRVSEIPFQMYAYRVVEREKTSANVKDKCSDSGSEAASLCGDENVFSITPPEDAVSISVNTAKSSSQNSADAKNKSSAKKANGKTNKQTGQHQKLGSTRPPHLSMFGRNLRTNPGSRMQPIMMSPRRRATGHASDSELT
ncbi:hypothetical protein C4D60_Mb07t02890 [Musa balbisiana]|uniref:Protein kinase domain-containing protein n=1 Tax=Musa balbisiana TaxID=52838 RepID=A0A4S8JF19_MUSBA|nr:hypothetical protein C4D60_Mb07t02890 [Musa balbisiana]